MKSYLNSQKGSGWTALVDDKVDDKVDNWPGTRVSAKRTPSCGIWIFIPHVLDISRDTVGQLSDKLYFVRNKQSYHLKKKLAGDSRRRGFYGQMSTTRTPYLVLFKNYKYDFISSFHIAKFISAFYFSLDFSKSSSLKGLLSQNRYVYIQIIYETTDYLFEKLTRFRSQFQTKNFPTLNYKAY